VSAGGNLIKIGRAWMALGDRERARGALRDGFDILTARVLEWQMIALMGLAGLEELSEDPESFRSFCRQETDRSRSSSRGSLQQWFREPARRAAVGQHAVRVDFEERLPDGWTWVDPFQDCSYAVDRGLELRAANGREMWFRNVSAPRVVRPLEGDFAAETICGPALSDRPCMGGLLIWQDAENFLHIERGRMGPFQLSFRGRVGGDNRIVGRGLLDSATVHLRLERRDDRVRALCSPDGIAWYTLGTTEAPLGRGVFVGPFAIGLIVRVFYHGAYPHGTAIRFASFDLRQ
jgi:hypothetical protein